ncbi:MAG: hypothetical protein HZB14_05000 [Actinobacteria bacterium]|nr:hypothetical protein [Actinomycetota bacterium]
MPRYLTIYTAVETGEPPTQQKMDTMGAYIEKKFAEGVLISTEGCLPSALGARVRLNDDSEYAVSDGPFTESKEIVGGFAILKCNDKAHAIEEAKSFMDIAGPGTVEVRELYDEPAA